MVGLLRRRHPRLSACRLPPLRTPDSPRCCLSRWSRSSTRSRGASGTPDSPRCASLGASARAHPPDLCWLHLLTPLPTLPTPLQNLLLPAGWDAPGSKPQGVGVATTAWCSPAAEPLRPANQLGVASAAAHEQQQQQQIAPEGPAGQWQHYQHLQQQHGAALDPAPPPLDPAAATIAVDWRCPEQVAALLRVLHIERLARQGQQLPPEYDDHHHMASQQLQLPQQPYP